MGRITAHHIHCMIHCMAHYGSFIKLTADILNIMLLMENLGIRFEPGNGNDHFIQEGSPRFGLTRLRLDELHFS